MKKYLRMTLNERAQHFNLMINFTVLVITGFALKYPEAFWAAPITDVPSGMTLRGFLHRLSGVALLALGGYHVLYIIFTKRGRQIALDMIPGKKDAIELWETLKNNLFINRPAKEIKMGRFNFREKMEYLALIWGTLIMTLTGFILWFEVGWLQYFPKWSYDLARAVHFYEAILATLAILVWHFYGVIFNPDVYPMNWAWITGEMTEHEMEMEHGRELEKLRSEEELAKRGEKVYSIELGKKRRSSSLQEFYGTVQDLNKNIKDWKGG